MNRIHSIPARLCIAAAGLALLTGCSTNPTTGKSQFNAISREEEIALGTENMPAMIKEYGGEEPNADLRAYIAEIGQKMAVVTEGDYPSLPWQFTLLNSDVINAFAMPGGKVFMSKGLAVEMTNEAQLAGVLGHEIGHVTARHINDQIARQTGVQVGVGIASIFLPEGAAGAAAGQAISVGGQTVLLKYGRDQESEADTLGMRYMSRVGYDPKGQLQVMEILDRVAGAGGGAEFFSTHPLPKTRIERIRKLLAGEYASTQNNPQYQLHEKEFQQRFLSKVTVKKTGMERPAGLALVPVSGNVKWDQPLTWCAVCREEEAARMAAR
ncbi:MAG: M48 family metalloprotease [Phycisphaerales bacterium]|nr:M48 family metalloprotease [Phycisphaerales bacterium]